MFIECSNCNFKYLVNSADLKPNGRNVECANCSHQWYQEYKETGPFYNEPESKKENIVKNDNYKPEINNKQKVVKNLPSTVVKDEKPRILNSIIIVLLMMLLILGIWITRSLDINTLVLVDFYIREFFFNLNLIVSDLAKIIYNILN